MNAQKFNAWRVFPRLMVLVYIWLVVEISFWYMGLPTPINNQATFAGGITAMLVPLLGAYMATGSKQ